ncbi:MAG: VTT domain-containing protein [Nitrospirae bacterium]|nr:VTT domain-containing protein [Nitrospirota bacterium]
MVFYETGLIRFFLNREKLLHFLDSLGPLAFIGFIVLQVAQVVLAPVPGEVTGLLGGFLYGPSLGVLLSTIGLTMGSYIAFALARAFGRPFVEKFVDKATMGRFDYLLHHKGAFLVFLLFLIPGFPKDYLCYILGLGHLSTMEFLVIGGTGRLFGTILLTLGGNYIRHHQYGRFSILVGVALVVVLVAMAYRDKLERWFRMWHIMDYKKKKAKRRNKGSV